MHPLLGKTGCRLNPIVISLVLAGLFFAKIYGLHYPIEFEQIELEENAKIGIMTIAQDSAGYLWVGTYRGIYRYDGYHFKNYNCQIFGDPEQARNKVSCIEIDTRGNLWAVFNFCVLGRYISAADTFQFYKFNRSELLNNSKLSIRCLEGCDSILYLGTSKGLYQYHYLKDKISPVNFDSQNRTLSINSLYRDSDYLWIGSHEGLFRYNPESGHTITYPSVMEDSTTIADNRIRIIYRDHHDRIWIGTRNNFLHLYDEANDSFRRFPEQNIYGTKERKHANIINSVCDDRSGHYLWIANSRHGLAVFDKRAKAFTYSVLSSQKIRGINQNYVHRVFMDAAGTIWLALLRNGLYKSLPNPKFSNYILTEVDDSTHFDNYVKAINQVSPDSIFIGTCEDGLYLKASHTDPGQHFTHDPTDSTSISGNDVYSIYEDNRGDIWFGTENGLDKFIPGKDEFRHYDLYSCIEQVVDSIKASISSSSPIYDRYHKFRSIMGIQEGPDGSYWVFSKAGFLYKFAPSENHIYPYRNKEYLYDITGVDIISCLVQDNHNTLWLGTTNLGLFQYDPETAQFIPVNMSLAPSDSILLNIINDLHLDRQNILWIGTHGGGLYRYNTEDGICTIYRDRDGLASNFIFNIIEDDYENLWLNTRDGISRFNKNTGSITTFRPTDGLTYHSRGACDWHKSHKYGYKEETIEYSLKSGSDMGAYKTEDGIIYFGGNNGYVVFNPADFQRRDNKKDISLVITDFKIFNKRPKSEHPCNQLQHIKLSHSDYIFSFDLALLDYTSPKDNQYSYILEGFEKEWSKPTPDRTVTYWNIPPGKYTLRARACNYFGMWSDDEVGVDIVITPPLHKCWWFRGLLAFCIAGLATALVWFRISEIQRQKQELAKLVSERTRELNTANEQLRGEIQIRKRIENSLRKSEEEYRELFENANDIIWTSDTNGNIITANKFLLDTIGHSKDSLFGMNVLSFVDPKHNFRVLLNYRKFLKHHYAEFGANIINKDQNIQHIWIKLRGIHENGKLVGIHGIGRDMTEILKAQHKIRLSEEQRHQSIKQLTLQLAHEIKNPLSSIKSSAQLAATSDVVRNNSRVQRHMQVISKNVDLCNSVVRELYSFTHTPAPEFQTTEIDSIIQTISSYVREKNESYPNISVETTIADHLPTLEVDEFRLSLALKNIIDNAFEAITEKGSIKINVFQDGNCDHLTIEIGDTGQGIPPEELSKIHTPFFTTKPSGFGLGIPIVEEIINAHKGKLEIASEKNIGSTFRIILPINSTAE